MKAKSNILITGGAGFIGSNVIHYLLENSSYSIINFDKLTYAGNLDNLSGIEEKYPQRYTFIKGDICDAHKVQNVFGSNDIDIIINFAAETHVDRAISDADDFLMTNVIGTGVLLKAALEAWGSVFTGKRFIQISTDEVYGAIEDGDMTSTFTEQTPLSPQNPYSVSKAAGDMLVQSFHNTYSLPVLITRCSNNFGERQYPEKLIPLVIKNALENKSIPVYGDGKNVRDWIYVVNHASAIHAVLEEGIVGNVYNIGTENTMYNIDLVKLILDILNKPHSLIQYVEDRLGHDRIYRMGNKKIIAETNWKPEGIFQEQLEKTVRWYIAHHS